jgi:hypothetical protein
MSITVNHREKGTVESSSPKRLRISMKIAASGRRKSDKVAGKYEWHCVMIGVAV